MSVLKIKDENGNWIGISSIQGEKGNDGDASVHAHRHAIGGGDELTPADIGASPEGHTHSLEEIGAADADHTHTLEELGAASDDHTHTPEAIGASPAGHNHDERYYTESEVNSLLATKAPFPTWGTSDIEAGSASSSPTGTIHYVIE